ncbi:MAG: glycosyltransferase [Gammaproteobacteria bacterium]|nr:glycosyltransferase [Gammaproteobacteria bacterium]
MTIHYSIIIPAYNEEDYLARTLENVVLAMKEQTQQGELIVVDNNSTDRTAEIARQAGAKLVFESENQIAKARNAGARQASGSHLVFLDADSIISPVLLTAALANLDSKRVCAGGARVEFETRVDVFPQRVLDFWNWYSVKRQTAAGCFVYCLKKAFDKVGGFPESVYASEEIWLCMALRKWARNNAMEFRIITKYPILTSDRKLLWYSNTNLVLQSLPILICPPLLRVQYFCKHWYRRPEKNKRN